MSSRVERIAKRLAAKVVAEFPEVGGGAFGAARLAALRERLQPQVGQRPGRPSEASWALRRKVPMSQSTYEALQALAGSISDDARKVSPMQVAAQLLEDAVEQAGARGTLRKSRPG